MLPVLLFVGCEDEKRDTGVDESWIGLEDTGPDDTDTTDTESGDSGETDTVVDDTDETGDTGEPCPPDSETVLWLCNAESKYLGRPGESASHAEAGDFDGDGGMGVAISAPYSSYGTGYEQGLVYVVNDPTPGVTDLAEVEDLVYGSGAGYKLQVGNVLDANRDGTSDAALVEWISDDMETEVYLLGGPLVGLCSVTQAELTVSGGYNSLLTPEAASGDLDADGVPELLLRTYVYGAEGTAALMAFPGNWTGSYEEEDAAWAITTVSSPNGGEFAGAVVADMSGDGVDDLIIGTPYARELSGAVRVFEGPISASLTEDDASATRRGNENDYLGGYTNTTCDFNADGLLDLAVGMRSNSTVAAQSGAVWVEYGPISGDDSLLNSGSGILGTGESEYFGTTLLASDTDSDGRCELTVSSNGSDASVIYVWREVVLGQVSTDTADHSVGSDTSINMTVESQITIRASSQTDLLLGWSSWPAGGSGVHLVALPWEVE